MGVPAAVLVAVAGCGSVWFENAPGRFAPASSATFGAHVSVGVTVEHSAQGRALEARAGNTAPFLAGFEATGAVEVGSSAARAPAWIEALAPADPGCGAGGCTIAGSGCGDGACTPGGEPGCPGGACAIASPGESSCAGGACAIAAPGESGCAGGACAIAAAGESGCAGDACAIAAAGESGCAGAACAAGLVELEAGAAVPREGVFGLDGRPTALTAIAGPGVQVDGVRVHLSDLEALAGLALAPAPSSALATGGGIEAWAELEHDALPRSGGETHVTVRVRASASAPRGRIRVHLVIDRSSSMQRSWERVLAAARMLVRRLRADDELHIVAYGTDAIEVFPVGSVGDGRSAALALDAIPVGGGTNIEAGLALAYDAAARGGTAAQRLVILLSDGVPNHGAFEPAELGARVADACDRGTRTSVIGLGTEFDARLLRAIARRGRGGYHVSASLDALGSGLVRELEAHARVAARDLSLRVALPAGVELVALAEGDAQIVPGGAALTMPSLDAGEERRLVLRVRVAAGARARVVAEVTLDVRSAIDGRLVHGERRLELSFGPRAVLAAGSAGAGVIDASLAAALDAAGDAILRGDAAAASHALEQHAELAEGRVEHARSAPRQARVRVVRRLARALGALVPGATHPQRRQLALAFGALSLRIAR